MAVRSKIVLSKDTKLVIGAKVFISCTADCGRVTSAKRAYGVCNACYELAKYKKIPLQLFKFDIVTRYKRKLPFYKPEPISPFDFELSSILKLIR